VAGFFNKLFPNWKPKTVFGKILKGATAVLAPVASALGIKKTLILAASVGAGSVLSLAAPVVVAAFQTGIPGLIKKVTNTIDKTSILSDKLEAKIQPITNILQPTVSEPIQQKLITPSILNISSPILPQTNENTEQPKTVNPWLIIIIIAGILFLIFRRQ
jgi:predicted PurR-regulated permease PerM